MKWNLPRLVSVFSSLFLAFTAANACTNVTVQGVDGTVVVGRTMEFAADLHTDIVSSPRDRTFNMTAPDGKTGLSWQSKYGYVFMDGLGVEKATDGIN